MAQTCGAVSISKTPAFNDSLTQLLHFPSKQEIWDNPDISLEKTQHINYQTTACVEVFARSSRDAAATIQALTASVKTKNKS